MRRTAGFCAYHYSNNTIFLVLCIVLSLRFCALANAQQPSNEAFSALLNSTPAITTLPFTLSEKTTSSQALRNNIGTVDIAWFNSTLAERVIVSPSANIDPTLPRLLEGQDSVVALGKLSTQGVNILILSLSYHNAVFLCSFSDAGKLLSALPFRYVHGSADGGIILSGTITKQSVIELSGSETEFGTTKRWKKKYRIRAYGVFESVK